ncbi:hypothetical protein RB597_009543 [Gaeumannomyces tritici]
MTDTSMESKEGTVPQRKGSGDSDGALVEHRSHPSGPQQQPTPPPSGAGRRLQANRRLANPLAGRGRAELAAMGEEYCRRRVGLGGAEDVRAFRLGAAIAGGNGDDDDDNEKGPAGFEDVVEDGLTAREREVLGREVTHKWSNPGMLYWVVAICSLCAAVQGMDETVVNGAQSFYKRQFGIGGEGGRDAWLLGLTNSAPYLCCAVLGCWLTSPMNNRLGRKGTVFWSCVISAVACFWQAFTNTWWHMFIARFVLGLGIGPKSATTPMFAAECAPPKLRGALVMQWQVWTAFGIMIGYVADLAFYFVPDHGVQLGLNWRLMMGSAGIPAVVVCCLIPFCTESPRWYLTKDRHLDAYRAICSLRHERVQAARDLFYTHVLLEAERETQRGATTLSRIHELFSVRRNRNAVVASEVVMFMQQFCGVNVIAYYSSEVFLGAGLGEVPALAASLGFGVVNWLFALPAFFTIDRLGRRWLLLATLPLMALALLLTGFSFWIPAASPAHVACIALGIYLFGVVYSPGAGPVPFTYSAEAYPLYLRPLGMSLATATTWFFNFVLSVTWPSMLGAFGPQGAFGWYAGWNVVGFFAVLLLVPETKERTLEELDAVFGVALADLARYGLASLRSFLERHLLRMDVAPPPVPRAALEARFDGGDEGKRGATGL